MRKAATRKTAEVGKATEMGKTATGRGAEMRKAAKRWAGKRECGGRKHGAADRSGGRQNESGSAEHDKLLC
jgi:hypothetical protein